MDETCSDSNDDNNEMTLMSAYYFTVLLTFLYPKLFGFHLRRVCKLAAIPCAQRGSNRILRTIQQLVLFVGSGFKKICNLSQKDKPLW